MTRVAVAGAAGFIGSHIVERMCIAGHEVTAIDREGADLSIARGAGARTVAVDLGQPAAAAEALAGSQRVVNATGLFDLSATAERLDMVNVDLARSLVGAARQAGAGRVVHLSSVAVYGLPAQRPMPENGRIAPRNAYERSKRRGERAVLAEHGRDIDVAVLRPTLVYGPRSRYGQAMMIALAAQARALGIRRLPVAKRGPLGHHVHVEDVAHAAELLAFHPDAAGRCFNVADDFPLPIGDSLWAIADTFGLKGIDDRLGALIWRVLKPTLGLVPPGLLARLNQQFERGHRALLRRGLRAKLTPRLDADWLAYFVGEYVFDTSRLKALGWWPRHADFRVAIGGVIDWYRQHDWLPAAAQQDEQS